MVSARNTCACKDGSMNVSFPGPKPANSTSSTSLDVSNSGGFAWYWWIVIISGTLALVAAVLKFLQHCKLGGKGRPFSSFLSIIQRLAKAAALLWSLAAATVLHLRPSVSYTPAFLTFLNMPVIATASASLDDGILCFSSAPFISVLMHACCVL